MKLFTRIRPTVSDTWCFWFWDRPTIHRKWHDFFSCNPTPRSFCVLQTEQKRPSRNEICNDIGWPTVRSAPGMSEIFHTSKKNTVLLKNSGSRQRKRFLPKGSAYKQCFWAEKMFLAQRFWLKMVVLDRERNFGPRALPKNGVFKQIVTIVYWFWLWKALPRLLKGWIRITNDPAILCTPLLIKQ